MGASCLERSESLIWTRLKFLAMALILSLSSSMLFGVLEARSNFLPCPNELQCNGDRFGLCDDSGKEILPCKYAEVLYAGNGIFLALEFNPGEKYQMGLRRHLFNIDGKLVPYTLPAGAVLLGIHSLGKVADGDKSIMLDALSPDAVLYGWAGRPFSCLPSGKICEYSGSAPRCYVGQARDESAYVRDLPGPPRPVFGKKKPTQYRRVSEGRWLMRIKSDDGRFDAAYFKSGRQEPISRWEMFSRFLKEKNLIGMDAEAVLGELGTPEFWEPNKPSDPTKPTDLALQKVALTSCTYSIYSSHNTCVHREGSHLKLSFKDNKVYQWFCYSATARTPFVTKPAVLGAIPRIVDEDYLPVIVERSGK